MQRFGIIHEAQLAARGFTEAQLIRHQLEPNKAADARHQGNIVNRLGQEIISACLKARHPVCRLIQRRHHDHRHMLRFRLRLEPTANLEAVHLRHHHIKQDDIRLLRHSSFERFQAIGGRGHVEVLSRQLGFQKFDIRRNVIDHENSRRHETLSRLAPLAQKPLHGFHELCDRDRLCDISLAASLPDFLLVTLHGKGRDGNHGDFPQRIVFLQPLRNFQAGYFRQLDIHQNKIRSLGARKLQRLHAIPGLERLVSMGIEQVMKQLHVQLVVLNNQNPLRHVVSPEGGRHR